MPARQGKSKEKIKIDVHTKDFYEYYKEHTFDGNIESVFYLTPREYGKFVRMFFEELSEAIIQENYEFPVPHRLGQISIRKYKSQIKIEDGKVVNNLPVDWNATLKLWEQDKEAKEKKILVKHLNKHSDGYIAKWIWLKSKINAKAKYNWWFRPTRTNKVKLASAIRNKKADFYTQTND